jgi:AraC-like DNA-binding protein/ligand-binding sensor protein
MPKNYSPEQAAWQALAASETVREQQMAFTCATGVPLTLAPASSHALADGTFCVKGCLGGHSGTACREKLLQAEKRAVLRTSPVRYSCPSGLMKIIVPVFINGCHAGSLLAGPFALHALDGERLAHLMSRLDKLGLGDRADKLQTTWKFTPKLTSVKSRAAETLLRMFGKYLEECGRQKIAALGERPSGLLQKIEAFLAECRDEHISLKNLAASVNLSPCHFCSVFKKQTGLTFSQYRTRQRLQKAKQLLADSGRRVSDVAFEAGFESIPYFNRAFRRAFGCSPSEFRERAVDQNLGQENRKTGVAAKPADGFNIGVKSGTRGMVLTSASQTSL